MAVKRDYGSFAKASVRLLTPQVQPLGYRPWQGGGFGRERAGWVEGFFLQQTQWGYGDFCVNIGIHVPGLEDLWAMDRDERHFGLLFAWRLNEAATEQGGERWYHAKNKEQLENNIRVVAATLGKADGWFQQFRSFPDVVEQYRIRTGLPSAPAGDLWVTGALNYGLLLLLAEAKVQATHWLRFAGELLAGPTYWNATSRAFAHEPGPGLKIVKPTKDDELRRRVIAAALAKAEA